MRIETERLLLRPYIKSDFDRVHLYASLPNFSQYDTWGPNTEDDTKKFITDMMSKVKKEPRYEFEFALCLKDSGLLIGGCGIRKDSENSKVANLGYAINPDFQSQGFATEATKELIKFGFEKLNLSVIYATCDTRNTSSFKVMEKVGMSKVGNILSHKKVRGFVRDSFRYEIYQETSV